MTEVNYSEYDLEVTPELRKLAEDAAELSGYDSVEEAITALLQSMHGGDTEIEFADGALDGVADDMDDFVDALVRARRRIELPGWRGRFWRWRYRPRRVG